jgi:hypothetical protein
MKNDQRSTRLSEPKDGSIANWGHENDQDRDSMHFDKISGSKIQIGSQDTSEISPRDAVRNLNGLGNSKEFESTVRNSGRAPTMSTRFNQIQARSFGFNMQPQNTKNTIDTASIRQHSDAIEDVNEAVKYLREQRYREYQ